MSVVAAAVVTGAKVPEKAAPVVAKVVDAAAGGDAAPTTAPTTTPVGTCEALLHRDAVIDFVHCSCQCPCWRSTQRCMKKVMGWPSSCSIWETVFMILTGYALFASDIQGAFCPVSFDTFFVVMTLLCLFMFMLELTMMSVASTRDEPYFLMFFFWLDMVAALSLLADIPWLTNALLGELTMARAGRAARAGTRAGRVVRVLRVLRLIRIVRLLKMFRRKSDDDEEEEDAGEEKKPTADGLSKKITELDTVKQIIAVLTMLFILPLLEAEVTDNGPAVLMQTITKLAAHADGSRYCTAIHDTVTELNTFTPPSRSWIQDWLAPPENTMAFPIRYLEIFAGASRTNHVCYNSTVVIDHGVSDLRKNELKKMWQPDAALTFEAKNVAVRIMVDNRAGEREGHVFNMMVTCFVIFILGGMAMISQKVGGILAKAITQPLANIATPVAALADMQLKDIKHMNMDSMKEMVAGDDDEDDDIAIISTKDSWMKCQGRRQCTLCCKCSLVVQEIRQLVYTFIKLKITIENIGLFIPVEVLQKSIVSGERITPKLEQRDASLMLCKFRDFEGMVAALSPNEMAIKIEEFHNAIATVLERDTSEEKGVILDFIGDAVLAGCAFCVPRWVVAAAAGSVARYRLVPLSRPLRLPTSPFLLLIHAQGTCRRKMTPRRRRRRVPMRRSGSALSEPLSSASASRMRWRNCATGGRSRSSHRM